MKKLMLLVAMLAMMVILVAAAPAMAQDAKAAKAQTKAAKAQNKNKTAEMPKTGGAPINAALLGLGGATIVVGGGLLVRKVIR